MATTKFSGVIAPGQTETIGDMTNLAVVGLIHRGFLKAEHVEESSAGPVPFYVGTEASGSHDCRQVGTQLLLTNIGTEDANVTVYEE